MLLSGIRAIILDAVGTLIHLDPPVPLVYSQVGKRRGSRHHGQRRLAVAPQVLVRPLPDVSFLARPPGLAGLGGDAGW